MENFYAKYRSHNPLLITCEHASSVIPTEFRRLGLSRAELSMGKDLYDPGSLEVAQLIAAQLKSSLIYTKVSRLVVDANRRLDMININRDRHHAPLVKSELLIGEGQKESIIKIPINQGINANQEKQRFNKYVAPYQKAGFDIGAKLHRSHGKAIFLSIHSFYPIYNGEKRRNDIDVLYDVSSQLGKKLIHQLKTGTNLKVLGNIPWSLKDADGGIFNSIQFKPGYELIAIDINNKLLQSDIGIKKISKSIANAIASIGIFR